MRRDTPVAAPWPHHRAAAFVAGSASSAEDSATAVDELQASREHDVPVLSLLLAATSARQGALESLIFTAIDHLRLGGLARSRRPVVDQQTRAAGERSAYCESVPFSVPQAPQTPL
jgi:hypothetical protein